ncbi:MAG: adenylate/guanylate cyclase domain-containing protein [Candidatus Riflebacteria bacterium]
MRKGKEFSPVTLLLSWLLLSLPFLLVIIDWATSRQQEMERIMERNHQTASALLETIQVSGSWEYQLLTHLNSAQGQMVKALKSGMKPEIVEKIYRESLFPVLPVHQLSIAVRMNPEDRLIEHFSVSTMNEPYLLGSFAPLMDDEPCNDGQYDKAAQDLLALTGFPVNSRRIPTQQGAIRNKAEGIMLPYNSLGKNRWLYWFYPNLGFPRVMIAAIFDPEKISAGYTRRVLNYGIDARTTGLAILPDQKYSPPFWSEMLQKNGSLRSFIRNSAEKMDYTRRRMEFGNHFIYSAPALVGEPATLVLTRRKPDRIPLLLSEKIFLTSVSMLFCILSVVLWQRRIFKRGWRISLGLVFLAAMTAVFYLPAGLGRMVVKFALDSYLVTIHENAEADLEKNLQTLEDRYNLTMSDFYFRLKNLELHPEILKKFNQNRDKAMLEMVSKRIESNYPRKKMINSLVFLTLQRETGLNTVWMHGNPNDSGLNEMFSPLLKELLVRFRPELQRQAGSATDGLSLDAVKNEMIAEFLEKFFQGILGEEMYHRLIADPLSLIDADSTFIKISISAVPIKIKGVIRAILLGFWSEFNESEDYLHFLMDKPGERPANFDFLALRKGAHQSYYKTTMKDIPPQVWDLSNRSRRVGIMLTSRELLADKKMLIKSKPGKALGLYILAGVTSLKEVFEQQLRLEHGFNCLLVFASVIIVILVILAYQYFINPLRQLQKGLGAIGQGKFSFRLAGAEREDEFGRIGRSFNEMARGLEEGSILGGFVSSAVVDLVRDPAAFDRAVAGERREMTILFASIDAHHDEKELQTWLDSLAYNLQASQNAISETSGVIDKVIENKVLIFFDHELCGGRVAAVEQGVKSALKLKKELEDKGHQGYWGLATGSVVAGILGARSIRLDYTVIGDAVNLAARLNALAADYKGSIVVDHATSKEIDGRIKCESLGEIQIKGKTAPVDIYRISR